jgi:hypothetical protein
VSIAMLIQAVAFLTCFEHHVCSNCLDSPSTVHPGL